MKKEAHRLGEAIASKDALAIVLAAIPIILLITQVVLRELEAAEVAEQNEVWLSPVSDSRTA